MTKKSFVVILVLSGLIWYISRYIVALFKVFILNRLDLNFYGDSCLPTGYPLFSCTNSDATLIAISFINIAFWFVVIWGVWKVLRKGKK